MASSSSSSSSVVDAASSSTPTSLETIASIGSALFTAVTNNDIDAVRLKLPYDALPSSSSYIDVNIVDSAGFTPLLVASRLGHASLVTYLLAHPRSTCIHARTSTAGNTAFLFSCAQSNVDIVRALLEAGANYFHVNSNGDTCMMIAATSGRADVFAFLVAAYHQIRLAKLGASASIASSARPWEYGRPSARRFFTLRNGDGLTMLMCAAMGGSTLIVLESLAQARMECGVHLGAGSVHACSQRSPSARSEFYPSIWDEVLGSARYVANNSYVDPAPPAFGAYVDVQNLMGDTALHIAAQNQLEELYLALIDDAGADPMLRNRRGKRSFELFVTNGNDKDKGKASVMLEEDALAHDAASASASPASDSLDGIQGRVHDFLTAILDLQRSERDRYVQVQASQANAQFSALMAEEEEAAAGGGLSKKQRKKKAATDFATTATSAAVPKKGGKKAKSSVARAAAAAASTSTAAASATSDTDSDDEHAADAPTASRSPTLKSVYSSSPSLSPKLSSSASPFVPLSSLSTLSSFPSSATASAASGALDADSAGWEVVSSRAIKAAKSSAAVAHAPSVAHAKPAANAATSSTSAKHSDESNGKNAVMRKQHAAAKAIKLEAKNDTTTTAASSAPTPIVSTVVSTVVSAAPIVLVAPMIDATPVPSSSLATSLPSSVPTSSFTLVPVPVIVAALPASLPSVPVSSSSSSSATASVVTDAHPAPASSFFASFASAPRSRAWRPVTQLNRRRSPTGASLSSSSSTMSSSSSHGIAPSSTSPSSSSPTLASYLSLFSSLHPHIDSTDLQLHHFLGSSWSSLSLSQLGCLDEVYAALRRQVADTQAAVAQQQQQDVNSEMVKVRSEMNIMMREHRRMKEEIEEMREEKRLKEEDRATLTTAKTARTFVTEHLL